MKETKRHGDAFDYYYSLGAERNFPSVALHCKCSERAVANWSKAFNWQMRLIQRDHEINQKTEAKTNNAIANTKADYRTKIADKLVEIRKLKQRISKLISDATKRIEEGTLKVETIKDLNELMATYVKIETLELQLVKQDLALIGEDGSEGNVIINFVGMEDDPFPDPFEPEESE